MAERSLSIRRLTKRFGPFTAVDSIDLEVPQGELIALLGPSGCGKTTTLRMVAGLERPTSGEIGFGERAFVAVHRGIELPPEKRNVGMVFQSYALWPHMTVFDNVAYPLKLRRLPSTEIKSRVEKVLELIGLSHLKATTVPKLSGGQQQRVALARALVYEPSLMLFDEPFSNLDAKLRGQMRMELKALRRRVAMTGLFVTHDQVEALSMADRVAIMNGGRIEQVGTPREVYDRPQTRFVRDFLGRNITLNGVLDQRGANLSVMLPDGNRLAVTTGGGLTPGSSVELSIRPEYVSIDLENAAAPPNALDAVVEDLLFTGERFEARLRIGPQSILLELPPVASWQEGQRLTLGFRPDAISLWPHARPSA